MVSVHGTRVNVMYFTQDNVVDLHSMGRVPFTFATTFGGKHMVPVKQMSLSMHDVAFFDNYC
jgi:hypothetical protein